MNAAENFIAREGYVRCDIPACNCGSWHPREGWYARFVEIETEVGFANGKTLLTSVKELRAALKEQMPAHTGCSCEWCSNVRELLEGGA